MVSSPSARSMATSKASGRVTAPAIVSSVSIAPPSSVIVIACSAEAILPSPISTSAVVVTLVGVRRIAFESAPVTETSAPATSWIIRTFSPIATMPLELLP